MSTYYAYQYARELYGALGVDTDRAMERAASIPVSIQCWQGDDVLGFETKDTALSGGIQTTGNYPGRARSIDELRADFEKTMSLVPGKKRLALHAIYLDSAEPVSREKQEPKHFDSWIDWAKQQKIGLDFNPTFFSHPKADGFTLSSPDASIREFWIEHGINSRRIAEHIGKELNDPVLTNFWMPDGYKDIPIDRYAARARMAESLDKIFAFPIDDRFNADSLESKLFGIGLESSTVVSAEFVMGYCAKSGKMVTFDTGHFHPTELVSEKLSAAMLFYNEVMLHVSRPVRWDSDHVVIFDDELRAIAAEIIRDGFENRIHIGLDYFDASINRIAAWTIGIRAMQKALLYACLEPTARLKKLENEGDYTSRLAMLEELKTLPFAAVWDMYCEMQGVPTRDNWLTDVKCYEADVLSKRA